MGLELRCLLFQPELFVSLCFEKQTRTCLVSAKLSCKAGGITTVIRLDKPLLIIHTHRANALKTEATLWRAHTHSIQTSTTASQSRLQSVSIGFPSRFQDLVNEVLNKSIISQLTTSHVQKCVVDGTWAIGLAQGWRSQWPYLNTHISVLHSMYSSSRTV